MGQVIVLVIQVIFMLFKNKLEKDQEKKVKIQDMKGEVHAAIKSMDASQIRSVLDRINAV